MTKIKFIAPVREMNGEFEKGSGIIMRKKHYRAPNGAVLREGVQESYRIVHPRDYEKNPPQGAELANMKRFGEAHRRSLALIKAGKLTLDELAALSISERETAEQLRAQLAAYKVRFEKQLTGTPDQQAPLLPKSSPDYNPNSTKPQRRRYYTLATFLRAIISVELKSTE